MAGIVVLTRGSSEGTAAEVVAVARTPLLQSFVTASGEIVATRFADIGSASMGRLVSLSEREGDRVKAGQTLARIDPVQATSSADAAAAGLRALEAEVQGAASQIIASQAELAAATARAIDAETALGRSKELREAGLVAPSDFDAMATTAEAARAQARAAQAAVQRLEHTRAAAERRVTQGRAELARARDQVDKTSITAPIDGVVTRLDVEEGEMVVIGIQNQPGTILMTISDLSSINAEVKVAEADVLRLSAGQAATATLEALPGTTFSGRVVEIGASALPTIGTQAAAREFKVKVRIEGDLKPFLIPIRHRLSEIQHTHVRWVTVILRVLCRIHQSVDDPLGGGNVGVPYSQIDEVQSLFPQLLLFPVDLRENVGGDLFYPFGLFYLQGDTSLRIGGIHIKRFQGKFQPDNV